MLKKQIVIVLKLSQQQPTELFYISWCVLSIRAKVFFSEDNDTMRWNSFLFSLKIWETARFPFRRLLSCQWLFFVLFFCWILSDSFITFVVKESCYCKVMLHWVLFQVLLNIKKLLRLLNCSDSKHKIFTFKQMNHVFYFIIF